MATTTERLAEILDRPVEPRDRRRARLHLLDWIGCAAAGTREPAALAFAALLPPGGGPSTAVLVGRAPEWSAALYNGALANQLEMDDTDRLGLVHPGDVVVPAALAVAEAEAMDGTRLLDALVRGYEAMIRLGRAVGPGHYRHFHNTATCGPFGAAAAVAALLGLDRRRTADALGHAASQAAGLWQVRHEPCVTKQLHTAHAAVAGLVSARLAAAGGAAPRAMLEGPQGLFAATCPDGDAQAVVAAPDAGWRIHETSFKPWPSCRFTHPAIEAAAELRAAVDPWRVEAIEIETFGEAIRFCDRAHPENPPEARFSLQHAVAVALASPQVGPSEFAPCAIEASRVRALRERSRVRHCAACEARFPPTMSARVRVTESGGRVVEREVIDALGDPERPLEATRIADKARAMLRHGGLAPAIADEIVARLLDELTPLDPSALLAPLARRPAEPAA